MCLNLGDEYSEKIIIIQVKRVQDKKRFHLTIKGKISNIASCMNHSNIYMLNHLEDRDHESWEILTDYEVPESVGTCEISACFWLHFSQCFWWFWFSTGFNIPNQTSPFPFYLALSPALYSACFSLFIFISVIGAGSKKYANCKHLAKP